MRLSSDEARALGFVALLLALSGTARVLVRPPDFAEELEAIDLESHTEQVEAALAEEQRRNEPLEPNETLDPNTAPAIELSRLPGVGPALAERIIQDREANGPFQTTGDLERVSGIGPRVLERMIAHIELPRGPRRTDVAGQTDGAVTRLDPNWASPAELETLPGIGPALAERIIAYRDTVGTFRSLNDFGEVPGIGPATLQRLRPYLRLDP